MTRAAIYARYSSDRQSERSAEDQARLCQERAGREGWEIAGVYADLALSGATRDRPGLNALLDAAEQVDVVLAESIDRLSRDQEDIAAIYKRLRYAGVRLVTLSEGDVGEIHVGLGGTMAALYLRQLGEKTRRGQMGRVEAGRVPGGLSYGYRAVPGLDEQGRPDRGRRAIDDDQAAIVRRIFDEFARGHGPKAIAERLNQEGIPSPAGGRWAISTILGNRRRGTGILHNALYAGRIVYNRQRFEKHPVTRKRLSRPNPEADWRVREVPELAIVPAATWTAVRQRFDMLATVPAEQQRRPKRLFSGLIRCGSCDGGFNVISGSRWGCSAHRDGRGCENGATISEAELERRLLGALREKMLAPDVVAAFVDEYHRAHQADRRTRLSGRGAIERRRARAQAQLDRMVDAIAEGHSRMPELHDRMRACADERDRLTAELADIDAEPVLAMHPNIAAAYRQQLSRLVVTAQSKEGIAAGARDELRALLEGVVATAREGGRGVDLTVHGRLAAILALSTGTSPMPAAIGRTLAVVAGTGFEPVTFRL